MAEKKCRTCPEVWAEMTNKNVKTLVFRTLQERWGYSQYTPPQSRMDLQQLWNVGIGFIIQFFNFQFLFTASHEFVVHKCLQILLRPFMIPCSLSNPLCKLSVTVHLVEYQDNGKNMVHFWLLECKGHSQISVQ